MFLILINHYIFKVKNVLNFIKTIILAIYFYLAWIFPLLTIIKKVCIYRLHILQHANPSVPCIIIISPWLCKHILRVKPLYNVFISISPHCRACSAEELRCVLEIPVLCVFWRRIWQKEKRGELRLGSCVWLERPFSVSKSPVFLPQLPSAHTHTHTYHTYRPTHKHKDSSRNSIIHIPVEKCTGKSYVLCLTLHVIAVRDILWCVLLLSAGVWLNFPLSEWC